MKCFHIRYNANVILLQTMKREVWGLSLNYCVFILIIGIQNLIRALLILFSTPQMDCIKFTTTDYDIYVWRSYC